MLFLTGGACPRFSWEEALLFLRRWGGCWYMGGYLGYSSSSEVSTYCCRATEELILERERVRTILLSPQSSDNTGEHGQVSTDR